MFSSSLINGTSSAIITAEECLAMNLPIVLLKALPPEEETGNL
jgi:hypothetical protein